MLAIDVYSLGVILWQLWTKESDPWCGKAAYKIMAAVTSGKRPTMENNVPSPLASLVEACWAQAPQERPTVDKAFRIFERDVMPLLANLPPAPLPEAAVLETGPQEAAK
jgi:hypothetical protein